MPEGGECPELSISARNKTITYVEKKFDPKRLWDLAKVQGTLRIKADLGVAGSVPSSAMALFPWPRPLSAAPE